MQITTIGLDLAKSVFQVHGVGMIGKAVVAKPLRRGQVLGFFGKLAPCLAGMKACSTAHHWARELIKLGHTVRLIPSAYVKPYERRGKNDAADAAAICEAVTRPSMRFVAVKPIGQQGVLMVHRCRDLLIRQRTQPINAMRAPSSKTSRCRSVRWRRAFTNCIARAMQAGVWRRSLAAAELERRQGAARRHLQAGRPHSAPPSRPGRGCGLEARAREPSIHAFPAKHAVTRALSRDRVVHKLGRDPARARLTHVRRPSGDARTERGRYHRVLERQKCQKFGGI